MINYLYELNRILPRVGRTDVRDYWARASAHPVYMIDRQAYDQYFDYVLTNDVSISQHGLFPPFNPTIMLVEMLDAGGALCIVVEQSGDRYNVMQFARSFGTWQQQFANYWFTVDRTGDELTIGVPRGLNREQIGSEAEAVLPLIGLLNHSTFKAGAKASLARRQMNARLQVPTLEYRSVCLDWDRLRRSKAESKGGTHASPRFHIRRAHWRRLKNGSVIWVPQCEVGKRENGAVVVDYLIQGAA